MESGWEQSRISLRFYRSWQLTRKLLIDLVFSRRLAAVLLTIVLAQITGYPVIPVLTAAAPPADITPLYSPKPWKQLVIQSEDKFATK